MRNLKNIILTLAAFMVLLGGCMKEPDRSSFPRKNFVMVYYCAGFNNLSSSISWNLDVLKKGDIPFKGSKHVLLAFTHFSVSDSDFETLTDSHLIRYTKDFGKVEADTLLTIDRNRYATDPAVMREVLQKVKDLYPDAHYGLVVSSHGTGWLPAGKYNSGNILQFSNRKRNAGLPSYRYNENPGEPRVKTFGAEVLVQDGKKYSQEITIQSMAKAIPMHLDYLLFDACLMGGVEVAYEFKDVADRVAFSPTEVLADGFDYTDISTLLGDSPSIEGFCERYFRHYADASSCATISVVLSSEVEGLASVCKTLFEKYRSGISALRTTSGVQPYFRTGHHWFYDLEDILVKANIEPDDKSDFQAALDRCITYKATTDDFLGVKITTYSGLSMYLPGAGDADLDEFYKTLGWNKATNLVE